MHISFQLSLKGWVHWEVPLLVPALYEKPLFRKFVFGLGKERLTLLLRK